MKINANVTIESRDLSGRVLEKREVHNLVVDNGRNLIRDLLNGTSTSALYTIAVGTGTTAPTAADTALEAQVYSDVISKRTTDIGKLTLSLYIGANAANGYTISEAGIFAADGTMFARTVFAGLAKNSSNYLTITWEITITAG